VPRDRDRADARAALGRAQPEPGPFERVGGRAKLLAGDVVRWGWDKVVELGALGPDSRRGRRFGAFGHRSAICFPVVALFNERFIRIGSGTMIGPYCALSAGMVPGQQCATDPVITIGDRCLIGRGSSIVGHWEIVIGDDVWTGPHVYITDQNHGYEDVTLPISRQVMPEAGVRIGSGSWLGTGTVVLPGADIGEHVVIGAGSVVTGTIPSFSVAAGVPARVLRRYDPGRGWTRVGASSDADPAEHAAGR
jgi:acetyltransferase-like isoleucine patch superfamily enzyme